MKTKGQIQMENMLLVGLVSFAALIFLYLATQLAFNTDRLTKAEDIANLVVDKVSEMRMLGSGSGDTVVIEVPGGIDTVIIKDKNIQLWLSSKGEQITIKRRAELSMMGTLNLSKGLHRIHIQKLNETLVAIGKYPILTRLIPNTFSNTQFVVVEAQGANIDQEAQLLLEGAKYPPELVLVQPPNKILFLVLAGSTPGVYNVEIRNPDGKVSSPPVHLTIQGTGVL